MTKRSLAVALACASAGIMIGVVTLSGLGIVFTQWVVALAQDTLFIALVMTMLAGIVLGIRWLVTQGRESRSDSALEILRQRYARGEINKDEFEAKKRDFS